MINKLRKATRGFTLIELLVVIAIIGLLASIVLVSLSSARRKARDARRVGDLRQVQLALEIYSDSNPSIIYPPVAAVAAGTPYTPITANTAFYAAAALGGLVPTALGGLPTDPTNTAWAAAGDAAYRYGYAAGTSATPPVNCVAAPCMHYILMVSLEDGAAPALSNDNDSVGATSGGGGFADTNGIDCRDAGGQTLRNYCVTG